LTDESNCLALCDLVFSPGYERETIDQCHYILSLLRGQRTLESNRLEEYIWFLQAIFVLWEDSPTSQPEAH